MLRVGENGLNWPILFRGLNSEFGCLPEKREIVDEKNRNPHCGFPVSLLMHFGRTSSLRRQKQSERIRYPNFQTVIFQMDIIVILYYNNIIISNFLSWLFSLICRFCFGPFRGGYPVQCTACSTSFSRLGGPARLLACTGQATKPSGFHIGANTT